MDIIHGHYGWEDIETFGKRIYTWGINYDDGEHPRTSTVEIEKLLISEQIFLHSTSCMQRSLA